MPIFNIKILIFDEKFTKLYNCHPKPAPPRNFIFHNFNPAKAQLLSFVKIFLNFYFLHKTQVKTSSNQMSSSQIPLSLPY